MKTKDTNRKGAKLRISEIYASLQGEGLLTGTPSVFLRTSGCNLRCWFCDTPFASWQPEGDFYPAADVVARTLALEPAHVVVTGGEPMIYRTLPDVLRPLHDAGKHLTIETAGTVNFSQGPEDLPCDLMSISPKLSSSTPAASEHPSWHARHESRRERLNVVRQLMSEYAYQLKFVVDSPSDAEEVLSYLERLRRFDADRILLMPQGTDSATLARQADWLVPWCHEHQFRYCPRSHIEWYGNRRGT